MLARLDFNEGFKQFGIAVDESQYSRPLRLETEARFALTVGADPEIADETAN
jgi:hypothetical protein